MVSARHISWPIELTRRSSLVLLKLYFLPDMKMDRNVFQCASKDLFRLVKVHNVCAVGGQLNTSSTKPYSNSLQKTVSVIDDFSLSVHPNESKFCTIRLF